MPTHIEMIDIQKLALHTAQTLTQPTSHGFISFHEGKKAADKELSHHLKVLETVQNKVIDLAEPHALNMKELQGFIEEAIAQTKAAPETPLSLQEAVNQLMASDKYKNNKNIQSRADELAVLTPEDVRKWSTETALIFRIGIAWQINDTLKNGTGDDTTVPLQKKVIANLGHDFSEQKVSVQATEESKEDATVESLQRHSTQRKHKTPKAKRKPMEMPDMGNLGSIQGLLDNLPPEEAERFSSIMKDPQAIAGLMQQAQGMFPTMMPDAAPELPTRK